MTPTIREQAPPPEAFMRRGACQWCGRRKTRITTWAPRGTSLINRTQICKECAGTSGTKTRD